MSERRAKLKGLAWLALTLALGAGAAAALPFFARHVPWSVELKAAAWLDGMPGVRACSPAANPRAHALFQGMIDRLYPVYPEDRALPLTVEPVAGSTVNAFAVLGAHIYVYEGLIRQADSPEELAGVVAHEIEHVRRRHIIQGVFVRLFTVGLLRSIFSGGADPELLGMLLNMRFSREQEAEADEGGIARLVAAQVDVAGFARFFEKARRQATLPAIVSDHPSDDARAALVARYRGRPSRPLLADRREWETLRDICR